MENFSNSIGLLIPIILFQFLNCSNSGLTSTEKAQYLYDHFSNPSITILPNNIQLEFVYIEPGTFIMGASDKEPGADKFNNPNALGEWLGKDERPQHQVTITKGFYLGKYEVTQEQWESVMDTTPWNPPPKYWRTEHFVQLNPKSPATYMFWEDAQAFIQKLNVSAGDSLYRLPTEAEWEYACRAGTTTIWSFGDDDTKLGEYAWYGANTRETGEFYAHEVGTKLPNPWGLHDMHGNVIEWCQDWFGDYQIENQVDPQGPTRENSRHNSNTPTRVWRSGPFSENPDNLRSAWRGGWWSPYPPSMHGFRILKQVK